MLSRKFVKKYIQDFLAELTKVYGYKPQRAVLFGSVAKMNTHEHSDIDLALWDARFEGCRPIDCEPIARLLSKFYLIELHTFELSDTSDTHPFVFEIEKKGVEIGICGTEESLIGVSL